MASAPTPGTSVQEYSIRVPKNTKKNYKVMRFNSSVNVEFTKWSQVKLERENNLKEFKGMDEEQPKFGAGSEFGRDAREEARRKKYGIVSKKYRPEDQPWLLKVGGKTGKKFKGTREGGVAENAAYYVFTHAPDGAIEAFPLQEWYNFQPTQRYKSLSAEEAEQEFGRRNRQVNYFSLMMRKRLRGEHEDDADEAEENRIKAKSKVKKGELKISEMDDWIDSSDSSESDEEKKDEQKEAEKAEKKEAKKKKELGAKKKKKKKDPDDEAFEESDDGDEEGREVDYISDSSDSASDHETKATKELKGVEEEDALRKLLSSGEEDDDEEEKHEGEKEEEVEEKSKGDSAVIPKEEKDKKGKKKSKGDTNSKKVKKEDVASNNSTTQHDSSSDLSSDSSDSENDTKKKQGGGKAGKESNSGASSRSATPTKDPAASIESKKRKATSTPELSKSKKIRLDNFASAALSPVSLSNGCSESGITEDAVRRYLMRKPMTTTELLQKFKSKKTGLTSDQLVNIMTQILKRINPVKQTIKGKMYLSIKG